MNRSSHYDLIYLDEDAHRVRPMTHYLEMLGIRVDEHCSPPDQRHLSDPYLVVCSSHIDDVDWLRPLLDGEHAVAVLIQPVTLSNHVRTVDLVGWPSRTADRKLQAFAAWLQQFGSANPTDAKAASKSRSSVWRQLASVGGIFLVFAGLFALLSVVGEPGQAETQHADIAHQQTPQYSRGGPGSESAYTHVSRADPIVANDAMDQYPPPPTFSGTFSGRYSGHGHWCPHDPLPEWQSSSFGRHP